MVSCSSSTAMISTSSPEVTCVEGQLAFAKPLFHFLRLSQAFQRRIKLRGSRHRQSQSPLFCCREMHGTRSDLKTVIHGAQHCDGAPDMIMEVQAATSDVTEASQREVLASSSAKVSHMITILSRNAKLWTGT